jgi:hypothetical protein
MLSWFSGKVVCPIPEPSRVWTERRMGWVMDRFGPERVRQARVILPTSDDFPDAYDGSEAAGERLFDRVCTYAGVERSRVHLAWVTGDDGRRDPAAGGPLLVGRDGTTSGAAGLYVSGGDVEHAELIAIDRRNLADPMQLVATAAHELCHVHLLGDGHVSPDEEDHEPLTDLLTVCLGLGIFGANASVQDRAWSHAQMSGWSVSKLGYLYQLTWAYALAVFAWVRGEAAPKWARHLRPDVRSVFRNASRYLDKHGPSERGLLE